MRFGLLSEVETPVGKSYTTRYWELVDEVILAEKMGFDVFGTSEQHFAIGGIASSCPEVLYPYLIAKTSRIRFRHSVTLLPFRINHPLRVAERVAMEDILSNGRIELYTGRGNTTLSLRAFNVDLNETKPQWEEAMDLIRLALSKDIFKFEGKYFQVPPRSLVPKPIQSPYPPMGVVATSESTHIKAGEMGIGLLASSNFQGFEHLARGIDLYRSAWRRDPEGPLEKPYVSVMVHAHCAETNEQAKEHAGEATLRYLEVAYQAYPKLAEIAKDYASAAALSAIGERRHDYEYLVNQSAFAIIGDPDTCIREIERIQALGADEIFLRIDSVPHDQILKSIELFGKYVIPHFKDRRNIVRPSEDVLGEIRAMRTPAQQTT